MTVSIVQARDATPTAASGASGVVRAYRQHDVTLPTRDRLFDREFTVNQAMDFYELIAPHYDARNSGELIRTHRETVIRLKRRLAGRPALRVLDLGGGTGHNIATAFFDDPSVSWTYVDNSAAMLNQFQRNLSGTLLFQNANTHLRDIPAALAALQPHAYDTILLSLVLSSMTRTPDFAQMAALLAPGGAIIVTDIDPVYTALHPFYAVKVDEQRYALRTNPVRPLEIVNCARAVGLRDSELVSIGYHEVDYSFLAVFEPI